MPNSTSTLRVTGLIKAYPGHVDRPAVDGVDFEIEEGHFFTLLGPSGCGKTTTMRCVAGLERPTGGSVLVDGAVMSDGASRHFVAPHRRPMGMVFQNYAIWPHLSVFENVAFPLKTGRSKLGRAEIRRRVEEALAVVQLADFIGRPATLMSGGQQQRLALARALVREPKILLLDEPLSNLDAKLRDAMRAELRSLQRRIGLTTLYVTHDQAEALSMSNRIAVMSEGRMVQVGSPHEIYTAPNTRFVADFIGDANFLTGTIAERPDSATCAIATPVGRLITGCPEDAAIGDAVTLSIRPQDFDTVEDGTAVNVVRVSVEQALYAGEHYDYRMVSEGVELAVRLPANRPRLRRGESVTLRVPADRISVISDRPGYRPAAALEEQPPAEQNSPDAAVGASAGDPR